MWTAMFPQCPAREGHSMFSGCDWHTFLLCFLLTPMVSPQASGSHHICIKYTSAFLREDGISRAICGLPMVSPLSLSEVCSKSPGIKTFHLVGRLVQMQDVKEEVKQHSTLQRSSTITESTQLQSFRKSLKLTRFTTPHASISSQNGWGGGSQISGTAWRRLSSWTIWKRHLITWWASWRLCSVLQAYRLHVLSPVLGLVFGDTALWVTSVLVTPHSYSCR